MDAPTAAVLAGGISIAVALLSLAIGGLGTVLISGGLSLAICYFILKSKADRRSAKFIDQFEAALQIMINSLKSGYGVSQAIETVAREAESPTSDEFRRIVTETSLGMDQIQALAGCSKRTGCEELTWVSEAIEVNREVGGNLSEVLVGIANTIRSRVRLARQVKALSAEGRISAKVLLIVPGVMFIFQFLVNRSAINELFHGFGLVMLLGSLVSMTIGSLWINQIVKVRF